MGYQMVTLPMTSRDPRSCGEAVRSAILATAWFLVVIFVCNYPGWPHVAPMAHSVLYLFDNYDTYVLSLAIWI